MTNKQENKKLTNRKIFIVTEALKFMKEKLVMNVEGNEFRKPSAKLLRKKKNGKFYSQWMCRQSGNNLS